MNYPSIDHSFLSPSGKRSKRANKQYMDKFVKELFPIEPLHKTEVKKHGKRN